MALGTLTLGNSGNAALASATTGSFTPAANSTIFVSGGTRRGSTAPSDATISDSVGLSWTLVQDDNFQNGTVFIKLRTWVATVGASPAAMTATVTTSGNTSVNTVIVASHITGAGSDFSNKSSGTSTTGDPSVTLPSGLATTSTAYGVYWCNINAAITEPTNFTEIAEVASSTVMRMEVAFDAGSAATTNAWSTTGSTAIGQVIEIKEAAVVASLLLPDYPPALISLLMR